MLPVFLEHVSVLDINTFIARLIFYCNYIQAKITELTTYEPFRHSFFSKFCKGEKIRGFQKVRVFNRDKQKHLRFAYR